MKYYSNKKRFGNCIAILDNENECIVVENHRQFASVMNNNVAGVDDYPASFFEIDRDMFMDMYNEAIEFINTRISETPAK